MSQLKFNEYDEGFGSELLCPACGGNYLHHTRTEIFDRVAEDSGGLHIQANGRSLHIDTSLLRNPSRRRDGLIIRFYCEACPVISELTVVQHKGNTLLDFHATEEREYR